MHNAERSFLGTADGNGELSVQLPLPMPAPGAECQRCFVQAVAIAPSGQRQCSGSQALVVLDSSFF